MNRVAVCKIHFKRILNAFFEMFDKTPLYKALYIVMVQMRLLPMRK